MEKGHLFSIDAIKGIAIIFVVIMHTMPIDLEDQIYLGFHLQQAVPLFCLLFGFNYARSRNSDQRVNLSKLLSKTYFLDRFKRILIPFFITFAFSLLLGLIFQKLVLRPTIIIGIFPFTGLGNYFISFILEMIVLSPFLYFIYRKSPIFFLIGMYVVEFIFDIVVRQLPVFSQDMMFYSCCVVGFFSFVALGFWLSDNQKIIARRNLFILILVPVSVLYLILYHGFDLQFPFFVSNALNENLFMSFYTGFIFLLLYNLLPKKVTSRLGHLYQLIGQASYHIFLVQILFFGLMTLVPDFWIQWNMEQFGILVIKFIVSVGICLSVGLAFYFLDKKLQNLLFKSHKNNISQDEEMIKLVDKLNS